MMAEIQLEESVLYSNEYFMHNSHTYVYINVVGLMVVNYYTLLSVEYFTNTLRFNVTEIDLRCPCALDRYVCFVV